MWVCGWGSACTVICTPATCIPKICGCPPPPPANWSAYHWCRAPSAWIVDASIYTAHNCCWEFPSPGGHVVKVGDKVCSMSGVPTTLQLSCQSRFPLSGMFYSHPKWCIWGSAGLNTQRHPLKIRHVKKHSSHIFRNNQAFLTLITGGSCLDSFSRTTEQNGCCSRSQ